MVYGHDGNHYAFNLQNFIYNQFNQTYSWGGGSWKLAGTGASGNTGNSIFNGNVAFILVGGSANAVTLTSNSANNLNNLTFIGLETGLVNQTGFTPVGNPPTGAQLLFTQDANTNNLKLLNSGGGGNVSGMTAILGAGSTLNSYDLTASYWGGVALQSYAWTTRGVVLQTGNPSIAVTDTTSSGTVAVTAAAGLPVLTTNATNATTYTRGVTLFVPAPVSGTNVTFTANRAIYATGDIETSTNLTAGGAFISGNSQINHNTGSSTSELGDGTTSGAVTIGGTSNTTNLSSAAIKMANLPTDATHTDRTVCEDTATFQLYFGSGTLGICLGTSSARYKHDIAPLDAGLAQIAALKPVKYKLNADHGDPNKLLYGFTAEQGSKVLPALSDKDAEGKPNTFDYVGVVPVLVKAVQELKADNDNLRASIRKLRYPKRQ
jgi:hypothetical protein